MLKRLTLISLSGLLLAATTCLASSPTPVDLALHLRVLASEPADLVPGSSGQIEFTVENRWTRSYPVYISSAGTPVAGGAGLPLRVFTPDAGADACQVQQASPWWPPGNTDVYWFIPGPGVEPGDSFRCRAGFEVLPAATRPMSVQFRTTVSSGTTIIYYDVTPWNNIVRFAFGTPATPVPANSPLAWLALALLLAGVAARRLQRRRTPRTIRPG